MRAQDLRQLNLRARGSTSGLVSAAVVRWKYRECRQSRNLSLCCCCGSGRGWHGRLRGLAKLRDSAAEKGKDCASQERASEHRARARSACRAVRECPRCGARRLIESPHCPLNTPLNCPSHFFLFFLIDSTQLGPKCKLMGRTTHGSERTRVSGAGLPRALRPASVAAMSSIQEYLDKVCRAALAQSGVRRDGAHQPPSSTAATY